MNLNELNQLIDLNELDILYKIIDTANSQKKDIEKILKGKKEPGIRVRDYMQDIRLLCEIVRDKIQVRKGAEWSDKRMCALDKAIKEAGEREIREQQFIEKKKRERLARFNR